MPTYLGEDIEQETLDMMVRVYREQFEAAEPTHTPTADDDAAILATLEGIGIHGGSGSCAVARDYAVNPPPVIPLRYEWPSGELPRGAQGPFIEEATP